MESHRLIREDGPADAEWLLEWDDADFVLKDPDEKIVIAAEVALAHRLVDLYALYAENQAGFTTPGTAVTFKKQSQATAALRAFVEKGFAGDAEYRSLIRRQSVVAIFRGLAMFLVGGGLFALYCWYASWMPDPPPGHWMRWFGWLLHGVLLVLMAVGLVGPFVAYHGFRQWLRVRRIERAVRETQG